MTKTGLVFDPCYLNHATGAGALSGAPFEGLAHQTPHPECPERIANVKSLLDYSGLMQYLTLIPPDSADADLLELVHSRKHVEEIRRFCAQGGGRYDDYTPMGPNAYQIALQAAAGCAKALDWIIDKKVPNAYALIRPPGHHATRHQAMGFCLFNNVAVAAAYARKRYSLKKILILDWDVHHGNGTQSIFYEDPAVLFISLHQEDLYPQHSGTVEEDGQGPGKGFTINIPLPAGTGDMGYAYAMEKVVVPVSRRFQPDLILVSAGQDAAVYDPFGRNMLTYQGFADMTAAVKALAEACCQGRMLMVQEGGYNIVYQAFSVLGILETLCGKKAGIPKLWQDETYREPMHFEAKIERVRAHHRSFWKI